MNDKSFSPRPPLDANALEAMAKADPDGYFLRGAGVAKLIAGIRALEGEVRALKQQLDGSEVRFPKSANEAALMSVLGNDFLRQHAPERLRSDPDFVDLLRDALGHIAHVARGARNHTRRHAWIEERAKLALKGKVPEGQPPRSDRFSRMQAREMANRYVMLRHRDLLPESADFCIDDLIDLYGDEFDAAIDALPPLPDTVLPFVEAAHAQPSEPQ